MSMEHTSRHAAQNRRKDLLVNVNMRPRTMTSSNRMVAHSNRYIFQHVPTAGKPAEAAHAGVACLWHDFCKKYRLNTSTIHPRRIKPTKGATVAMFLAGSVIFVNECDDVATAPAEIPQNCWNTAIVACRISLSNKPMILAYHESRCYHIVHAMALHIVSQRRGSSKVNTHNRGLHSLP